MDIMTASDRKRPSQQHRSAETTAGSTTCPICARPSKADYTPFCSRRCADIDLDRWLKGNYAIPGEPVKKSR